MVRLVKLINAEKNRPVYVNAENIIWAEALSGNETSIRFVGSVLYLWPEACDSTDCEKPLARFELVVPRFVHEQTQGTPTNVAIGTDEFGLHANSALYPTTLALMGPKPASATA